VNPKVKITKEEKIKVCSLTCNTMGVKRRARALRWGLRQVTSGSIIHTNLHNPNNKLVNAWLKHFWCTNEPWAYMDSQDSPRYELGEATTFPLIVFSVINHRELHPNVILS